VNVKKCTFSYRLSSSVFENKCSSDSESEKNTCI
jgi:hypothetical protein